MTNPSAKSARYAWRAAAFGAAFALGVGWSSEAKAQGWLGDPRLAQGVGIRTGDLELHPGIGGEVGYDSNWFLRSNNSGPTIVNGAPALPPADAAVFRITPSFYVSTTQASDAAAGPTQPRFMTLQAGVSATGRFFIGKEFTDQHNVSLNADARATFNQGHPIGFSLFGAYARVIQPQVFADPNLAFNRNDLRVGGDVLFVPGGGTLDLRAGYALAASLYEESNGVPFSSVTHEVTFKDRWKFRPRTAVFSEAGLSFINYPNAPRAAFLLNDATPLRTRAGVTGLVTNWFGTTVAGGYSATFFKNPELLTTRQFDSFNAQVDGTFYIGAGNRGVDSPGDATLLLSTATIGFQRDFQRSLIGNFYGSNRAYVAVEYWFGNKVVLNGRITGEMLDYPPVFLTGVVPGGPGTGTVGEFTNYRLIGGLFAEYRFSSTLGLNTSINYTQQFSSTQLPAGQIPGTQNQGVFDQNYGRLQAFLGFRYFL